MHPSAKVIAITHENLYIGDHKNEKTPLGGGATAGAAISDVGNLTIAEPGYLYKEGFAMSELIICEESFAVDSQNEKNYSIPNEKTPLGGGVNESASSDLTQQRRNYMYNSTIAAPPITRNGGIAMTQRFIKYIPSDLSDDLLYHHPKAFLLLCIIANRARRFNGHPDGLQVGDAILGDYEATGFTRKEYRSSLEKLQKMGLIAIVYNGKKFFQGQKRAINRAIKSTIVNLTNSGIWDINSDDEGQQKGQQKANCGPTAGHKQERIRKKKKEKEEGEIQYACAAAPASHHFAPVADFSEQEREGILQAFENPEPQHGTPANPGKESDNISIVMQKTRPQRVKKEKPPPVWKKYPQRRPLVNTSDEWHNASMLKYSPELIEAAYDHLNNWKSTKSVTDQDKHSDEGRLDDWAITAARKKKLEQQELAQREERLKQTNEKLKNPQRNPYETTPQRIAREQGEDWRAVVGDISKSSNITKFSY